MRKICVLLSLVIVLSACYSSKGLYASNSSNDTRMKLLDEDKVVLFAEDFLGKIYPDMNLEVSESNYIYRDYT